MKLVNFWCDQEIRLGFVLGAEILDAASACVSLAPGKEKIFHDTISFIRAGEAALALAARLIAEPPADALHALDDAKLAAPIQPSTILCAGSNYREHNDEKAGSPTSGKEPEFFVKTSDSVIGPDENIRYDEKLTRKLDCETELAVVIGKPGRHIAVEDALGHVFGYTIVNDVTARDRQVRKSGGFTWYELGRGKAFDTSAPTGPWIVTAHEIPDPQALDIEDPDQRRIASIEQYRQHDLDLRRVDPLLLGQFYAAAGHDDHYRHAGRHRMVRRSRTRRPLAAEARRGRRYPLLPPRRPDRK